MSKCRRKWAADATNFSPPLNSLGELFTTFGTVFELLAVRKPLAVYDWQRECYGPKYCVLLRAGIAPSLVCTYADRPLPFIISNWAITLMRVWCAGQTDQATPQNSKGITELRGV